VATVANVYPRESTEFVAVAVTNAGSPVTTSLEFAVVADGARPTAWTASTTLSGNTGILITGLTPGFYRVWARVTSSPETPVIECGVIQIT
jgi:hypothetical protein